MGVKRGLPEGEWVLRGGYQRGSWCRRGYQRGSWCRRGLSEAELV